MLKRCFLAVCLLGLLTAPALADRNFPPGAKRASITAVDYPRVRIGNDWLQLAPGAMIFDPNNQLVMPGTLPDKADILVLGEPTTGLISKIWLLTPQEVARLSTPR